MVLHENRAVKNQLADKVEERVQENHTILFAVD